MSESTGGSEPSEPVDIVDVDKDGDTSENNNKEVMIGEPDSENFSLEKSVVWSHNYFRKDTVDKEKAICLSCEAENKANEGNKRFMKHKVEFKTNKGSTSGLRNHILTKHKDLAAKFLEQEASVAAKKKSEADGVKAAAAIKKDMFKQTKLVTNNNNELNVDIYRDPAVQERWDLAVIDFMSVTYSSFSAMEHLDILLKALYPNAKFKVKVRSRKVVAKQVTERANDTVNKVFSIIQELKKTNKYFAVTTDLWRSKNMMTFMSLTVHCVDENFRLVKMVPFIKYFENSHTGKNLKLKLDQMLNALNLKDAKITAVCDTASNNKLMLKLSPGINAYFCNIHKLQLAVWDCFKFTDDESNLKALLVSVQDMVNFIRRSENNRETLKSACKEVNIGYIVPERSNSTRWNSTLESFSSIIKLKRALQFIKNNSEEDIWDEKIINNREFSVVEGLAKVLEVPKIVTKRWEGEAYPTIQNVVPELYNLREEMQAIAIDHEGFVNHFAKKLEYNVEKRFPDCGTTVIENCIAHYLDPR